MCTFQGERFLAQQMESIARQSHANWELWVSDDMSQDNTCNILKEYALAWGPKKIKILAGSGTGFAKNFMSLALNKAIDAPVYAFSDQDDIWQPYKLERGIKWIQSVPSHIPALYCSRTELIDEQNIHIGQSPLFRKPPSFQNALVQNVGGGNTMVFNRAAWRLISEAGMPDKIISHDWWVYMLISGADGKVFYDSKPTVRYRQHKNNTIGCNNTLNAKLKRFRMILDGRFSTWLDFNLSALHARERFLSPTSRRILRVFSRSRNLSLRRRIRGVLRSRVYRQTIPGSIGLLVAIILRKL
jgi:glycosyltransferase involved in cell wall biosynthesis